MSRRAPGLGVAIALGLTPIVAAPLGRLSAPFTLLLVLPPLAISLEALGWRERLAVRLRRIRPGPRRLSAGYATWLVTSAALSIDVAAVASASVGLAVAADRPAERRWQLGGAILGSNVGSLLLPFSNLTNLVLVGASGVGLATYVKTAVWPQLACAVAVGCLFAVRAGRTLEPPVPAEATVAPGPRVDRPAGPRSERMAALSGLVAVLGAIAAVAFGLIGLDMAIPLAIAAACLAGMAVAQSRLSVGDVRRALPVAGLAVVLVAAVAAGPLALLAGTVPLPDATPAGLAIALLTGGLLAATVNNLPAAAFGGAWLAAAHPATIVAFLVGTNVAAVATPHGSVATMLARSTGDRLGTRSDTRAYLRTAWPYAIVGSAAGFGALALLR